jgi:repressor of nif and glnA expression
MGFYRSYEEICNHFGRKIMKRAIAGAMRRMNERQLIQKHSDWDSRKYTITKLGLRAVQEFKTRVFQAFNIAA